MSLDASLKSGGGLSRHRNVLTRAERVAKLADNGEFDMAADNPLGIRKVANRKLVTGKSAKKKKEEAE
ncbi:MAG: small basic protein [Planctomycetota bacterium]